MNRTAILVPTAACAVLIAACDNLQQPVSQAPRKAAPPAETASEQAKSAPAPSPAATPAVSPVAQLAADKELSRKVRQALDAKQEGVAAARDGHIEVAASDGVVTLYGTVAGAREKQHVALLAMSVDGVRSVVNNLVIVQGS
jgi:osmotically-inducible protein OsmY